MASKVDKAFGNYKAGRTGANQNPWLSQSETDTLRGRIAARELSITDPGGGLPGGGDLNAALDELDTGMLQDWESYNSQILAVWQTFEGNHGQMVIVQNHIIPAVTEHLFEAEEMWPETGGPSEYIDAVMGCYDSDVISRAFSEILQSSAAEIGEYWGHASSLQHEHEGLAPGVAPHSTNPPWTA